MEKYRYMMMLKKSKTYNRMTKKAVTEHVENIRGLDDAGKLEICGVFKRYANRSRWLSRDMPPISWLPCKLRIVRIIIYYNHIVICVPCK